MHRCEYKKHLWVLTQGFPKVQAAFSNLPGDIECPNFAKETALTVLEQRELYENW
jgi:hypothetical protein